MPSDPDRFGDPDTDAFVTHVMRAIVLADLRHDTDLYREVMDHFDPQLRDEVEAAQERHAARRRAAGEPGW